MVAPLGAQPCPTTAVTLPSLRGYTRTSPSPPRLYRSCSTTPPTSIAATPASKALPPFNRISKAAAVVSGWPADAPPFRPPTGGRWVGRSEASRARTILPFCAATLGVSVTHSSDTVSVAVKASNPRSGRIIVSPARLYSCEDLDCSILQHDHFIIRRVSIQPLRNRGTPFEHCALVDVTLVGDLAGIDGGWLG